jgi:hypothetical protein
MARRAGAVATAQGQALRSLLATLSTAGLAYPISRRRPARLVQAEEIG